MPWLVSHADPQGHVVMVNKPDDCVIKVVIDPPGHPLQEVILCDQDQSGQLPDLILYGMRVQMALMEGSSALPESRDVLEFAKIALAGSEPYFLYAHPDSQTVEVFEFKQAARLLSLAVSDLVTEGVASDAADVPDDLSNLPTTPEEPGAA